MLLCKYLNAAKQVGGMFVMSQTTETKPNPFAGWTTIEDAASMVGRDHSMLRKWANNGLIAAYPVGRKVRLVNIEEVKAFDQERRLNPTRRKRKG